MNTTLPQKRLPLPISQPLHPPPPRDPLPPLPFHQRILPPSPVLKLEHDAPARPPAAAGHDPLDKPREDCEHCDRHQRATEGAKHGQQRRRRACAAEGRRAQLPALEARERADVRIAQRGEDVLARCQWDAGPGLLVVRLLVAGLRKWVRAKDGDSRWDTTRSDRCS
jgi:hypothetical protein